MDARLVASRMPGLAMYGAPYTTQPFSGYLPYASPADPTAAALYGPMAGAENAEAWRNGLNQAAAAGYFEPQLAAHYGYGYGPMGLADGARRKNATRETTSTLKAWLNEHRKNPYPTKGEKIMLAIITKMTLTQVSTWFANARRRLKKENKMTWSPRNRCDEDDDDDMMDDDEFNSNHNKQNLELKDISEIKSKESNADDHGSRRSMPLAITERAESLDEDKKEMLGNPHSHTQQREYDAQVRQMTSPNTNSHFQIHKQKENILKSPTFSNGHQFPSQRLMDGRMKLDLPNPRSIQSRHIGLHAPENNPPINSAVSPASSASSPLKPKIWSLADVATSNNESKSKRTPSPIRPSNISPVPPTNARQMIPNPAFQQEAIRNWMDGLMQHQKQMAMAAAAMAGASQHPHAFNVHETGLMPHGFPSVLRDAKENKMIHPYGLAGIWAAQQQQRNALAAEHALRMSMHHSKFDHDKIISAGLVSDFNHVDKPTSPQSSMESPTCQTKSPTRRMSRPSSSDSGISSSNANKDNNTTSLSK